MKDLRERYAKIEINVSKPIVPFRETIVPPYSGSDEIHFSTSSELPLIVRIKARPLPKVVVDFLISNAESITRLFGGSQIVDEDIVDINEEYHMNFETSLSKDEFLFGLQSAFMESEDTYWHDIYDSIRAFGPKKTGPNILAYKTESLSNSK